MSENQKPRQHGMRVDLGGLVENVLRGRRYKYGEDFMLRQLVKHLQQLRDRTERGDLTVLDDFFSCYIFDMGTDYERQPDAQHVAICDLLQKARDTFRDFEKAMMLLGRTAVAEAARVAADALDESGFVPKQEVEQ